MVFKKIFKGIKTGIKGIARGVKKAFKSFGKFMGKIGILGQVAMFFIMPYIGSALGNLWTGIAGQTASQALTSAQAAVQAGTATAAQQAMVVAGKGVATGLMKGGTFAQGVGKVMQFTSNTVGKVGNAFNNVTKAVTDTLTNFSKTASNKLFGTSFDAASSFFGPGDSAFSRSFGEQSRIQNVFKDYDLFDANGQLKSSVVKELPTAQITQEGGFEKVDYSPVSEVSTPKVDAAKLNEIPLENFTNEGFTLKGKMGDIEYTFGDRTMYLSPEKLQVLQDKGAAKLFQDYQTGQMAEGSLLENLSEGIKNIPEKLTTEARKIAKDPLAPVGKFTKETLTTGLRSRALAELGLVPAPTYEVQNISNVAYVPSMDSFSGGPIQTPDIQLDPQLFQTNVMQNPNPWGYTAFQYGQYMAQKA